MIRNFRALIVKFQPLAMPGSQTQMAFRPDYIIENDDNTFLISAMPACTGGMTNWLFWVLVQNYRQPGKPNVAVNTITNIQGEMPENRCLAALSASIILNPGHTGARIMTLVTTQAEAAIPTGFHRLGTKACTPNLYPSWQIPWGAKWLLRKWWAKNPAIFHNILCCKNLWSAKKDCIVS